MWPPMNGGTMSAESGQLGMWTCICGKKSYASKSDAKAAKQRYHPHDKAIRPYACDLPLNRVWHLGHQTADRDFYRNLR